MPFRIYSITISRGDGISPNLTTYLYMQNKDDSHRPCCALFRRVGTLLAVQLKDILSRHLRATLPKGGKATPTSGNIFHKEILCCIKNRTTALILTIVANSPTSHEVGLFVCNIVDLSTYSRMFAV